MGGSVEKTITLDGVVTTLAGSAGVQSVVNASGTAARFSLPSGVTTDGINIYIADVGNQLIRQIVIATGATTTIAGDGNGSGVVNGTGTQATFMAPVGITTDGINIYVADWAGHTIRQIVIATHAVTTLAGNPSSSGFVNGVGAAATFDSPWALTTDGVNVYVADSGNNVVRQIVIATGAVTTLAGSGALGFDDGAATTASFNNPRGITTDGTNVYVADTTNNMIRQVAIATGAVTTLAGSFGPFGSDDGTGPAAQFNAPSGITSDGTHLYVGDSSNNTIRQIVIATAVVTTLAGNANASSGAVDATGAAARFSTAYGVTSDGTSLYVADRDNDTIRKIQ
jgi:hypothetical protein